MKVIFKNNPAEGDH